MRLINYLKIYSYQIKGIPLLNYTAVIQIVRTTILIKKKSLNLLMKQKIDDLNKVIRLINEKQFH